jgi:hypothetical protein
MEGMESLVAAVDEVVADPSAHADGESLVELRRQIQRLEAAAAVAAAEFDASQSWVASGAKTAAAWLAWRSHLPIEDTRRQVRLGKCIRSMPATRDAWLTGDLSPRHVVKLAGARQPRTEELFDRDEAQLVGEARKLSFRYFCRVVDHWLQHADPDGAEDDAEKQRAKRAAHLDQSFQGMWFGKLTFDPISGTIVSNTLKAIEADLFKADWADAKDRLGRDPLVTELRRTPAQRRADAFVEMATRARSVPKGARRPKPLFTVLVGYETFRGRMCELANRTVVTPGSLLPHLTDALIERVVFDGPSRVLDVGEARCFVDATRRAVEVLGLECFDDTCEVPAEDAQIDHVLPSAKGGPTRTWNGRPACGYHNRFRNRGP